MDGSAAAAGYLTGYLADEVTSLSRKTLTAIASRHRRRGHCFDAFSTRRGSRERRDVLSLGPVHRRAQVPGWPRAAERPIPSVRCVSPRPLFTEQGSRCAATPAPRPAPAVLLGLGAWTSSNASATPPASHPRVLSAYYSRTTPTHGVKR